MISGTLDLQKLLWRDSAIVFVCLTLVIALSWAIIDGPGAAFAKGLRATLGATAALR